jgi:hypothetical protein
MTAGNHIKWGADLADLVGKALSARTAPKTRDTATELLFSILRQIGEEANYVVAPGKKSKAYLLDLIWFDEKNYEIAVGVESEWNQAIDEVTYDFEKLMFVKTPVKVLAYLVPDHDMQGKATRNRLEAMLEKFTHHMAGDEYLLIEFSAGWSKAQFHALRLPSDGQVNPFVFKNSKGHGLSLGPCELMAMRSGFSGGIHCQDSRDRLFDEGERFRVGEVEQHSVRFQSDIRVAFLLLVSNVYKQEVFVRLGVRNNSKAFQFASVESAILFHSYLNESVLVPSSRS